MQASERWRLQSAAMGKPATDALVAEAMIAPGLHVLDIASGTGEPAISIASALGNTGQVVATDISADPLEIARARAQQRELTNIEFQQADAHLLPFPNTAFDRVTSRLGIMFFANPERAFAELLRVLKPGGRFSLLAWGPMEQPYFQTTIQTILQTIPGSTVPSSGLGMFRYGQPKTLADQLRAVGFASATIRSEVLPWTWKGAPDDFWSYFQDVTAPFKPLLKSVPAEQKAKLDEAVIRALEAYDRGGKIEFTATFTVGSATKG